MRLRLGTGAKLTRCINSRTIAGTMLVHHSSILVRVGLLITLRPRVRALLTTFPAAAATVAATVDAWLMLTLAIRTLRGNAMLRLLLRPSLHKDIFGALISSDFESPSLLLVLQLIIKGLHLLHVLVLLLQRVLETIGLVHKFSIFLIDRYSRMSEAAHACVHKMATLPLSDLRMRSFSSFSARSDSVRCESRSAYLSVRLRAR